MKPKLHVGGPVQCFSRKLFFSGAAGALLFLALTTRSAGNTNVVAINSRVIPGQAIAAARVIPVTGSLGANPASVVANPLASASNQMTFDGMDASATGRIARVLATAPLLSAQTDPDFTLGVQRLELIEPSPTVMRPRPRETTLGVVVRFFVPNVSVSSPQGGRNVVLDESDRPWAVISAGAATGKSWNEPDTYRAQGFFAVYR